MYTQVRNTANTRIKKNKEAFSKETFTVRRKKSESDKPKKRLKAGSRYPRKPPK